MTEPLKQCDRCRRHASDVRMYWPSETSKAVFNLCAECREQEDNRKDLEGKLCPRCEGTGRIPG